MIEYITMETIRGLPSTFTVKLFVCILDLLPDKCILQISDYIYQAFPEGDFSSLMPFFICEKEAAYYFILSKECLSILKTKLLNDCDLIHYFVHYEIHRQGKILMRVYDETIFVLTPMFHIPEALVHECEQERIWIYIENEIKREW